MFSGPCRFAQFSDPFLCNFNKNENPGIFYLTTALNKRIISFRKRGKEMKNPIGATYYKINNKIFAEGGLLERVHGYQKAKEEQRKNGGHILITTYFNGVRLTKDYPIE